MYDQSSPNLELSDLYTYDPLTGEFFWKVDRYTGKNNQIRIVSAGDRAGGIGDAGYVQLRYEGRIIKGHRLAWFFVHGEWIECIDHIDGDRLNNAISNLRPATRVENAYNSKLYNSNTSGVKGVTWNERKGLWATRISVDKQRYFLGYFADIMEAAKVIADFRHKHHGEFANDGL